MDSNKDIVGIPLIQSRLDFLLKSIYINISSGNYYTQEQISLALHNVLKSFSNGVDRPIYDLPRLFRGTPPDRIEINNILIKLFNELSSLSEVLYKTGTTLESNFNFAVSKINKLNAGLKYCHKQLSVYSLYLQEIENTHWFGETFSTNENLDIGSKFLSAEECLINLEEGTISLPAEQDREIWPIKKASLGERSNGILGSNVEKATPLRGRIKALHDGNVDTWVEFERVVAKEDLDQLTIELKIALEDRKIVNGLRIIPVFLGARTPVELDSIFVSDNGKNWISLKKEISVVPFLGEKEEERYHLSPHTGKFSGEFNVSFPPRFIQFVTIRLHQSSAYSILDTNNRSRLRYAIGIKEIEVYGTKYKDVGELISKPLTAPKAISAVAINSIFDPIDLAPEAGTVEYFISFDDGVSWNQLSRQSDSLIDIPEVLFPPSNQTKLRYKIRIEKNEGNYALFRREKAENIIEQKVGWADTSPFRIPLSYKPSPGTLTICDPDVGTVGNKYPKIIIGRGAASTDDRTNEVRTGATTIKRKIPLPASVDTRDLNIEVNGVQWTKVSSFTDSDWDSRDYLLSKSEDGTFEVVFGNGSATSPKGMIPGVDEEISIWISDEQLKVENNISPYIATFKYPTDGVKEHTSIFFDAEPIMAGPEKIPSGVKVYQLEHFPVCLDRDVGADLQLVRKSRSTGILLEGCDVDTAGFNSYPPGLVSPEFGDYKSFVDGYTELENAGDWTIDTENGKLYFYTAINSTQNVFVNYYYYDRTFLRLEDWDFVEGSLDKIQIYESGFRSTAEKSTAGSSGDISKILSPLHPTDQEAYGIIPKSVRIAPHTTFGSTYIPFEVPFINGKDEFAKKGKVDGEELPTIIGAGTAQSFTLDKGSDFLNSAPLFFSDNTLFSDQKVYTVGAGDVTDAGDWCVNPSTGEVWVWLAVAASTSGVTVSYLYEDVNEETSMTGAYSVNTEKGIVHFSTAATTSYTIYYKLTPFKARYSMSYQLEEGKDKDYIIDRQNQEVVIKKFRSQGKRENLIIKYKYEPEDQDLLNLSDYFSPLLRGLAVKVALA